MEVDETNDLPENDVVYCSSCQQAGHSRRTSRLCPNNGSTQQITLNIAKQSTILPERHSLGRMTTICPYCSASMWVDERSEGGVSTAKFQLCCGTGKYVLPPLQETPPVISNLLRGNDQRSKEFKKHIRSYNNALGFTSMGVKLDSSVQNSRGGAYAFRIHGSIYHRIGSLLPPESSAPSFAQIYVYDAENEINNRHAVASHVDIGTLADLQTLMHDVNPIVRDFKTMNQFLIENPDQGSDISMLFRSEGVPDPRRYNAPTNSTEIGILILGSSSRQEDEPRFRDIVIRPQNGGELQRINELNQMYDPMSYVLIFPLGQPGWHINYTSVSEGKVTAMQYYSFRLMYRESRNDLHLFGKLFHQFIVDMYAKIEQCRLNYLRHNQSTLRSELYSGLQDAVAHDDTDTASLGQKIILPSSFIGSPRHMSQLYQDAISIVRRLGKPDFFITFTCNPSWPEIQNELLYGQTAADRPDLCSRVFHLKFKQLIKDITKDHILGVVIGYVGVIEFQKRGLPHAHMLFIVRSEDKPRTTQDFDKVISAEIPDPETQPLAYATVTRNMMHGPCGSLNRNAICMKDGVCSKQYPKKFTPLTTTMESGYPVYRRRRDNKSVTNRSGIVLDNTWVVPHNVYLCTRYDAHINVEICNTVSAVKYLYKYVYKGHDRASVVINRSSSTGNQQGPIIQDEINQFVDARYVSAPEATWRIFGFSLHKEFPAHQRLSIHLPNQEMVYFQEESNINQVVQNSRDKKTTLTAYFALNEIDQDAHRYLYNEIPEHYTWHKKETKWKKRQRGFHQTIGRIYTASPKQPEKFYLRMLLNHVRGAKCFEDVRTFEGITYETFQCAARARGLLADDNQWDICMTEGNTFKSPAMLRRLFSVILIFCEPSGPFELWNSHKDNLAEDYLLAQKRLLPDGVFVLTDAMVQVAYGNCLLDLNDLLNVHNMSIADLEGFQLPSTDSRNRDDEELFEGMSRLEREQRELCLEAERDITDPADLPFNENQRSVFQQIMQTVESEIVVGGTAHIHMNNNLFFLDGPGGTGKTFLFNALLQAVRRSNLIALSVAVSGTASLLLKGGRTAHSRFSIPLKTHQESMCHLKPRSNNAKLIALSTIIVWDEASMISRDILETVDRSLRDIMKGYDIRLDKVPFGGKLIVFGGDFRQVLPVVPKGSKDDIIQACMITSSLWRHIIKLRLTTNMRVQQAQSQDNLELAQTLEDFAHFLLSVGNGSFPVHPQTPNSIRLPDQMLLAGHAVHDLCHHVYNDFRNEVDVAPASLVSKAVLTPTNAFVAEVNNFMLQKFPGEYVDYISIDTAPSEDDALNLPPEFMNSLECGSLPPHKLRLKIGSPVMMLRNLAPMQGVCNGTRLICRAFLAHTIQAEVATGPYKGNTVLIPRITVTSTVEQVGVEFKRCQFPIRPAFAMTINKSQGQTLDSVGLYLPAPVFSHGQLYVALSRVKKSADIKIAIAPEISKIDNVEGSYTSNVVYTEIFRN